MLEKVSDRAVEQLIQEIAHAVRILITGENCSGLVVRMVAMKLMHLGYQVYIVGTNIARSIMRAGDLLIACSESGSSVTVCAVAQKAREVGARIVSLTTQVESVLGQISNVVIKIVAAKQNHSQEQSQQFVQQLIVSSFEQSTLLLFDALFYVITQKMNKSVEALWTLHTSLE